MIKQTIDKIHSILEAVGKFQVIYNYERADADGTPFATITPSANESAYKTTTENRRIYAFDIRLFVDRKGAEGSVNVPDESEAAMRLLVDDCLDALDRNWDLSGIGTRTGYTFLMMEAAPSSWGYVGRENEYRVAEITVRVHFDVDVNVI